MIVRGRAELEGPGSAPGTAPVAADKPVTIDIASRTAQRPDVRFSGPNGTVTLSDRVSPEAFTQLVGKPAFLRIARRDGRSEILAAEIKAIDGSTITLGKFDVDTARRLAAPGDDFWVHVPKTPGAEPMLTLASGDAITSAVQLPVQVTPVARAGSRRVDIKRHAVAIKDGTAEPQHDLQNVEMTAATAARVKAEQNAIVMALAGPLTEMLVASARIQGVTSDVLESREPLLALELGLRDLASFTTSRFARGLARDEGPLGKAWARLRVVHAFAQDHLPGAVLSSSPTHMLDQGMSTAVDIVGRLAEIASVFAARHGGKTSDILRASLPLVAKLAATHQKILNAMVDGLESGSAREGRWSPQHFVLADGRLELAPELLATVAESRGARFDALPSRTTGCPAVQSTQGTTPVKQFVELYAELVDRLEAATRRDHSPA